MNAISQFKHLLWHALRTEWVNKERLLSPMLFAATILLLFFFAFGEVSSELRDSVHIAQSFLSAFFALQLGFSRIYTAEEEDGAFTLMRTYPLSPEAWFLAKYLVILLYSFIVIIFCQILAAIFNPEVGTATLSWPYLATLFLAVIGPAGLGVLLSALLMRSSAKQLVFPLLYFPLTVPVLLAAVQSQGLMLSGKQSFNDLLGSWLGLLIIFDVIYVTICTLAYGELIKAE